MTSALARDTGPMTVKPATAVGAQHPPFGSLMKQWRQRRRISQLELAIEADVSSRHLSFIETGRSVPSRAMVLRLADALDVPLREQNRLLMAAGLAPVYGERSLADSDMAPVRDGVDKVLEAYEPYPCLAVDRGWNIVAANAGAGLLLTRRRSASARSTQRAAHLAAPRRPGAPHSQSRAVAPPRHRSAAQGGGRSAGRRSCRHSSLKSIPTLAVSMTAPTWAASSCRWRSTVRTVPS